jgi:hypothetical protein
MKLLAERSPIFSVAGERGLADDQNGMFAATRPRMQRNRPLGSGGSQPALRIAAPARSADLLSDVG